MAMMGLKRDVKAFNPTQRDPVTTISNERNMSAKDYKKLGTEYVGDILNQVTDPNWTDPTKKIRTVGSDKLDKDAFFKLMMAQMRAQDPMNPQKSHEMAAQLAQFTQLEQMANMNSTLEQIQRSLAPTESFDALKFIGKTVSGDSARLERLKGDTHHSVSFALPAKADKVLIQIRDSQGNVIRNQELRNVAEGRQTWTWNGKTDQDTVAPTGSYRFTIQAIAENGRSMAVKTDFAGKVTGVSFSSEGPVLIVGNQTVKLKDVQKIIDDSLDQGGGVQQRDPSKVQPPLTPDQKKTEQSNQALSRLHGFEQNRSQEQGAILSTAKANKGDQAEKVEGAAEPEVQPNILDSVSVTGGMRNKLQGL
jgi:flagellar basal-body rod modification protein FlgD